MWHVLAHDNIHSTTTFTAHHGHNTTTFTAQHHAQQTNICHTRRQCYLEDSRVGIVAHIAAVCTPQQHAQHNARHNKTTKLGMLAYQSWQEELFDLLRETHASYWGTCLGCHRQCIGNALLHLIYLTRCFAKSLEDLGSQHLNTLAPRETGGCLCLCFRLGLLSLGFTPPELSAR